MDFQRAIRRTSTTFADVLAALREKYGQTNKLDPVGLAGEAELTLRALRTASRVSFRRMRLERCSRNY
jgi:hypothetical protein